MRSAPWRLSDKFCEYLQAPPIRVYLHTMWAVREDVVRITVEPVDSVYFGIQYDLGKFQ